MKYGNLIFLGSKIDDNTSLVNIGDYLQCLAIANIYNKMGIDEKEIINLTPDEVTTYAGKDYVILPLNWGLFDENFLDGDNRIKISPKIIPVFLSMTTGINYDEIYFNSYNIQYFKNFEPIGCRDEVTMSTLRKFGIKAYLNGCLSAVFPKRKINDQQNKILLIDVPSELYNYIPKKLLDNYEVFHQQYYISNSQPDEITKKEIVDRYKYYEENAKLIITSRLHVASPAMAMGIPVIFVKSKLDMRFSWLDKYLQLYTPKDYNKINWNPVSIEYENMKEIIIKNSIRRIKEVFDSYNENLEISEFYEFRSKNNYVSFTNLLHKGYENAIAYLNQKYKSDDYFEYGIWGLNKSADNFYEYMCLNYKNAKLTLAVDLYKQICFHGIQTIKPDKIDLINIDNMFVLPVGASNMATNLFKLNNVSTNKYCICAELYI